MTDRPAVLHDVSSSTRRGLASGGLLAVVVGILGVVALAAALRWDDALWSLRSDPPTGPWLVFAHVLSASANGAVLIPGAVFGAACLGWSRRASAARWLLAMTLAGTLAGLSGTILRSVIGRARPLAPVPQGWHGPRVDGHWVIGRHAYGSFPSGHTSLAAGFGTFLFLHRRRSGLAGLAYAAAVGWSRVEVGAHRPSDVVAGIVVGGAVSILAGPLILARLNAWLPDKPMDAKPPGAAT